MTLAYVFWHWKQASVDRAEYERRQAAFHAALTAAPSDGFVSSLSVAVTGVPWAAQGGEAYEDWYRVRDWSAIGALNDAAAAAVADGTAGLYGLKLGAQISAPRVAHWFAKPAGMRYDELLRLLSPLMDSSRGALWM